MALDGRGTYFKSSQVEFEVDFGGKVGEAGGAYETDDEERSPYEQDKTRQQQHPQQHFDRQTLLLPKVSREALKWHSFRGGEGRGRVWRDGAGKGREGRGGEVIYVPTFSLFL